MRTSLSCDSCRRAKVKCIHSGTSPCQRCHRTGITSCTLSRPRAANSRKRISQSRNGNRAPSAQALARPEAGVPDHRPDDIRQRRQQPREHAVPTIGERHSNDGGDNLSLDDIGHHITSLSKSVILKTFNIFSNKFPELAILHIQTFVRDFESVSTSSISPTSSSEIKALLAAVLAVTRGQITVLGAGPWANGLLSQEQYASYARETLSNLILERPRIRVVQSLLIVTLHEWGTRNFHKAWVYCGIAIRIMQAIHSLRVAPLPQEPSETEAGTSAGTRRDDSVEALAIETRTYWGCFIMDCMVNSGTYNPPMLPMSEMRKLNIARPLSSVEFAFGPEAGTQSRPSHVSATSFEERSEDASGPLDITKSFEITQSFEILVGGFSIWARVMEFVFNDGRKAPGMRALQNCPWVPGSPWHNSRSQLREWRARQHRHLHYPATSVAVHMTLGYGETFTYLNLLYYVSVLMLAREYVPFLPTPSSVPQGPVDNVLEAPAPDGWWENNATELFGSAEQIAQILREASDCGVHLITPFAGFCAFSALYVLVYIYRFPNMNLGRSPRAEEYMNVCLDYLDDFGKVWKIAEGWMKTIQCASLLYSRAATTERYRGRSRADFEKLHLSAHEFRGVDRSNEHTEEMNGAERAAEASTSTFVVDGQELSDMSPDTNTLLNQLLAEVSTNADEQGPWSQWWPLMEEVDLRANEQPPQMLL